MAKTMRRAMHKHAISTAYFVLIILTTIAIGYLALFYSPGETLKTEDRTPIKISLDQWPGYGLAHLANVKGHFQKNGVDVDLLQFKDTAESREAFIQDGIQGSFSTLADSVIMNAGEKPNKICMIIDHSTTGDAIIGRNGIKNLSELRNKTIGVEGVNSFSHRFVATILQKKAGLEEWDYFVENVNAHDVARALREGRIDAGHTWEPTKSQAITQGGSVLAVAGDIPGIITDVLIFDKETSESRPDDIAAIILSLEQARQYAMEYPQETASVMAQAMGVEPEAITRGIDGLRWISLEENIALLEGDGTTREIASIETFWKNRGQIQRLPDIRGIIDNRPAKLAMDLAAKGSHAR